eukprot:9489713-Pyramimonas_sp.AAC.3
MSEILLMLIQLLRSSLPCILCELSLFSILFPSTTAYRSLSPHLSPLLISTLGRVARCRSSCSTRAGGEVGTSQGNERERKLGVPSASNDDISRCHLCDVTKHKSYHTGPCIRKL